MPSSSVSDNTGLIGPPRVEGNRTVRTRGGAIEAAWRSGAALAGCSAGAIALSAVVRDRFAPDAPLRPALGVVPHVAVLPHFDRLIRFRPRLAERRLPEGLTFIGVDEDTAI